jgi:hypothetical protein
MPQPMTLHTKESPMLFPPYRNEFFIQMEVCRTDSIGVEQTSKEACTGRGLADGERTTATQAHPSPAASRGLAIPRP